MAFYVIVTLTLFFIGREVLSIYFHFLYQNVDSLWFFCVMFQVREERLSLGVKHPLVCPRLGAYFLLRYGKDVVFFEMILHLSVCRPSRILTVTRIIQTNLLYMIEKNKSLWWSLIRRVSENICTSHTFIACFSNQIQVFQQGLRDIVRHEQW